MADRDVEGLLRWSLACMALASAVIHASAAADHPGLRLQVAFFLVLAAVQGALAAAVLHGRSGRWVAVTAAINGAVAVVWVLSRTVGLPVEGAAAAEPIGFKDGISTLLEVGIVAGAGLLAALPEAGRRIALTTGPLASIVIAASACGLGVSGVLARHTHDDPLRRLLDGIHASHHALRADESSADGHSHPTEAFDPSEAHDHSHKVLAPRVGNAAGHHHAATFEGVTSDVPASHHDSAHRQHGPDGAVSDHDTGRDGHQHDPEHHPGAGHDCDPGDDTGLAGRLIEAARRLVEPDCPAKFPVPITPESEVPT